jgi:hypothetical protein
MTAFIRSFAGLAVERCKLQPHIVHRVRLQNVSFSPNGLKDLHRSLKNSERIYRLEVKHVKPINHVATMIINQLQIGKKIHEIAIEDPFLSSFHQKQLIQLYYTCPNLEKLFINHARFVKINPDNW